MIGTVTPSAALLAVIEPLYPKPEGRGSPLIALEKVLRMYIAQECFGLSDEAIEYGTCQHVLNRVHHG